MLITAGLLLAAAALAALLAVRAPLGVDYTGAPSTFCDCPGTPIRALAHGRLHDFLATQPVMGSASLILRAPFAWFGLHLGAGSERDLYRLGAFPCLLAAGILAVYLFGRLRELRRPLLACVLLPVLLAVNPLTRTALRFGHPEEVLAASLCVGALLAAARGRVLAAGVLLGAAVATKQWALLAVLPALAAAGPRWTRLALAAAVTAAVLIVPVAAGDLPRFMQANHSAGVGTGAAMPTNIWFPFGWDVPVAILPNGASTPPRALPAVIGTIAHPLILLSGFALGLVWWRGRRGAHPEDALVLLALILLVRCLLDPITNGYYHLPFLMALAAWEGLRRRGAPLLTVAATLLLALTSSFANGGFTLTQLNGFYLAWALPFAVLLGVIAFRPGVESDHVPREEVLRWAD